MATNILFRAHRSSSILSRVAGVWFGLVIIAFAAYAAHIAFGLGGSGSDAAFNQEVYNAVMLGAALTLLMRAASRTHDRAAVLLIGLGLTTWALGDLYYTIVFANLNNPPFPSFDDALYLAYYPFLYVGLGLLIRARFRGLSASDWLDGLIAGLGLAAVAAGLVLGPILDSTGGSVAAVATNLAYPVGDLLLLLVVVTAIGLTGWRPGAMWALMAFSLIINVTADTIYLFQVATNTTPKGPCWNRCGRCPRCFWWEHFGRPPRPRADPA
jgi:hypothetical protein